MINRYLLVFLVGMLGSAAFAQTNSCKQELQAIYESYESVDPLKRKNSYEISYEVENQYNENYQGDKPEEKTRVDMLFTDPLISYRSNYVSYFADDKNCFVVVHPSKQVVWRDLLNDQEQDQLSFSASATKDSMLYASTEVACKQIDGKSEKEMTLQLPDRYKEVNGIEQLKVRWSTETNQLVSQQIIYLPNYPIVKQVYTYLQMEESKVKKKKSAYQHVFVTGGKLQPEFADYELIDQRVDQ